MKPAIVLAALFIAACAESPSEPGGNGTGTGTGQKPDTTIAGGEWGSRAQLLVNNSEFALAEANGKLYVMGGYPPEQGPSRTSRAVQVYDIATDRWTLGPQLPQPNNHGMAASVNGKVYLLGGQTTDDQQGATAANTVYEPRR